MKILPHETLQYNNTLPKAFSGGHSFCVYIMLSLLLAQPSGSNIVVKVLWFVQWPFSLLRWMSVPPFGYVSVVFLECMDSYCI